MIITARGFIPAFILLLYFAGIASAEDGAIMADGKNIENGTSAVQENGSLKGLNSIDGHILGTGIRVLLDHIFISRNDNSLEVSEIVLFRNDGTETYYSRDNHTFFAVSTPADAKNLKTQAMECCLVQEGDVVLMDPMLPVQPGDTFEMQVAYALFPTGREYMFRKSALYNTSSLSMFIDKKSGIRPDREFETLTLKGNDYAVIVLNDLGGGEAVSIPITITDGSGYFYAGIIVSVLFSVGLLYYVTEKIFRKRSHESTLEELELEKNRIFRTIHGFEKHAGSEKSEEYQRLVDEYRQKAIQVFIKIDKLKRREQSKSFEREMRTKVNNM